MAKRRSYGESERAEALRLYREHGPAEAARKTGIPSNTIRSWALRAGEGLSRQDTARANVAAARLTWAQRRAEVAVRSGEMAAGLLERAEGAKPRDARDLMASFKIALDAAQLLDGAATERVEISASERVERVQAMRDEVAARRQANAA